MSSDCIVLVVEDDEDDFFLTERVVRRHTRGPILHVENGRDAIDYLNGQGPYADRAKYPHPEVVFLDLKMDPINGHDVLAAVRANPPVPLPRIYVLTGSNEPRDREMVRSSGVAAGYLVKPLVSDQLTGILGPRS